MSAAQNAPPAKNDSFLNLTTPNLTRVFDYLAGGVTNFEVDRQVAKQMLARYPFMRTLVRLGKAFTQEAAKQLYQEGFEQFLDLGSSIPSELGIHTFAPTANVVYTDINPIAVSYGDSLFAKLRNVFYTRCDVRQIEQCLNEAPRAALINRQKKLAVGFNFLSLYLSPKELRTLVTKLAEALPQRSKIFQILYTRSVTETDPAYTAFQEMLQKYNFSMQLYTMEDTIQFMQPWRPFFIETAPQFLGLPSDLAALADGERLGLHCSAAFFELS